MTPNLLIVTGSLYQRANGSHWTVVETARHLQTLGVQVLVAGTKDHGDQGPPEDYGGLRVRALAKVGPRSWHYSPFLGRWLNSLDQPVDVVSLQSLWLYNHYIAARWCQKRQVPYIVTIHGNLRPEALRFSAWKKRMAVRTFTGVVLRRAACLHVFSERELEDVRQYGCRHPVCVIPNGVVLDQTPAEEKEVLRKEFRRRVGTDRVCLFLGRLDPIKGLDMLFEAWAAAGRYTEGWKLILAGPGSDAYVRELREHAERLRLTEQIVFLGPVYGEAKREAYLGADCFVLPSRSEGMPMAALEAMAHRLPILITEPCNLPGVHASGAGIQVPSSVDGLRGGLLNLLGLSTAESVRMAARATALLQNEYHWPAVARQLIEVYRWLREQGPVPATVRLG